MSFIPRPYEIYKHFKGKLYQITAIAEHTETGETLVIYQALYGDFKIYARPLSMFTSRVDREKYPDAAQEFRFELQSEGMGMRKEPDGEKAGANTKQSAEIQSESSQSRAEEPSGAASEDEPALDDLVIAFLDADTYEQKLNILTALHHRITDGMITTMAISCDIEVNEGDIEERYEALRSCLMTLEKYECNRLR